MISLFLKSKKGFSFIDVLVGISLMLIIFLGIFGAYQLGLKTIGFNQRKITATAIASGQIEKIRNLPYLLVGTKDAQLPFAQGVLDPATTTFSNNIEYQIETKVKFVVDEADGTGDEDSCNWDYKRAEIRVSWSGRFSGEVKLVTDIAPKDKVEEVQTCQSQPGGILSISVFDAQNEMVPSPLIEVFNPSTGLLVDSATPFDGKHDFPLATSTYRVITSKYGYSTERTYGIDEIAIPKKPNPTVLEGKAPEIYFSIDILSSLSIETFSPWGTDYFSDSFSDESKISEKSNLTVSDGKITLAAPEGDYLPSGYLISTEIYPPTLIQWDEFLFTDEEPFETDLNYQIYYASGTEWYLIPDSDLPQNSVGFESSPVNLSDLATTTYPKLKLKGNFSTESASTSPILYDWQISWRTGQPTPIGNVIFNLRGGKLIGRDDQENPVYKYNQNYQTDSQGKKDIANLEWDNYTFSLNPANGLDLVDTDPSPPPIGLAPNTNLSVKLFLEAQNSLLITVQNQESLEPVFSASIRLHSSSLGYDTTQYTNDKGQTLFIPLEVASYNIEVSSPGYSSASTTVWVSGDVKKTIKLEQIE